MTRPIFLYDVNKYITELAARIDSLSKNLDHLNRHHFNVRVSTFHLNISGTAKLARIFLNHQQKPTLFPISAPNRGEYEG